MSFDKTRLCFSVEFVCFLFGSFFRFHFRNFGTYFA